MIAFYFFFQIGHMRQKIYAKISEGKFATKLGGKSAAKLEGENQPQIRGEKCVALISGEKSTAIN